MTVERKPSGFESENQAAPVPAQYTRAQWAAIATVWTFGLLYYMFLATSYWFNFIDWTLILGLVSFFYLFVSFLSSKIKPSGLRQLLFFLSLLLSQFLLVTSFYSAGSTSMEKIAYGVAGYMFAFFSVLVSFRMADEKVPKHEKNALLKYSFSITLVSLSIPLLGFLLGPLNAWQLSIIVTAMFFATLCILIWFSRPPSKPIGIGARKP